MGQGRLAGRKALVTGAASGIGRETALLFAREGAAVVALDVNAAGLEGLADHQITTLACDLSDASAIAPAVDEAARRMGGLDAVVNAAGILIHRPFEEIDAAQWQKLFAVNLLGLAMVCQAAAVHMRNAPGASIVNFASQAAVKVTAGTSAYAATKAGVLTLSKCLALELAPIRVNAVCPGIVETAMTKDIMDDPAMRQHIVAINALHGVGQPADIASAVLYLTSNEASFVTGTQILIDGGSAYT